MPGRFYRRVLPHLQRDYKPHFITFCTQDRWVLPDWARSIVLDCCLHDRDTKYDLHVAVVMPHHAHVILTPLISTEAKRVYSLAEIMDAREFHLTGSIVVSVVMAASGRQNRSITCCVRLKAWTRSFHTS